MGGFTWNGVLSSVGGSLADILSAKSNADAAKASATAAVAQTTAAQQAAQAQLVSGDKRTMFISLGVVGLVLALYLMKRAR